MEKATKETWAIIVKVKVGSTPITREIYCFNNYDEYQNFEYQLNLFYKAKWIYEERIQEQITNQEFVYIYGENYKDESFPWMDKFCNLDLMEIKNFCYDMYCKADSYDFFDFKTIHEIKTRERETIKFNYEKSA